MSCKDKNSGCSIDIGRGCEFCRCNDEATAVACKGYHKLHTTDWLEQMPNIFPDDILEIRFKNTRRSYFKNVNDLPLKPGDIVAVEASPGHDIGIVSLMGDIVAKQMRRVGFNPTDGQYKKIYRKAKPYDIEKWQEAIALEHETMIRSRQLAAEIGLNMKIGDVEYQGDKIKAIFYYIADERVDFRELIKVFSEQFHIRIEMKQIGARQEAGRIGGLGSCGRELCCASWISSFVSVTTNAARTQEISLNPQKLAGQCSKLKCCMVYELDNYIDAKRTFPRVHQPLQAMDGEYYLVKNDILAQTMSFSTSQNTMVGIVTLPVERVKEVLELNKHGKKVDRLAGEIVLNKQTEEPSFVDMVGEDSITRFDNSAAEERGQARQNRRKPKNQQQNRERTSDKKTDESTTEGVKKETSRGAKHNRRRGGQNGTEAKGGENRSSGDRTARDRNTDTAPKRENREGSPQKTNPSRGRDRRRTNNKESQPTDTHKTVENHKSEPTNKRPKSRGRRPAPKPKSE